MIADAVARYDAIYRQAMEAWEDSKKTASKVKVVDYIDAVADRGSSVTKKKKSVRSEHQGGDAAFLAHARNAVDAICKLLAADAPRRRKAAAAERGLLPLDPSTKADLHPMTAGELRAARARLAAGVGQRANTAEPPDSEQTPASLDEASQTLTEKGMHGTDRTNGDQNGKNGASGG
jgi:photosystem II stability/assembly factor-like uncharacterized protein